MKNILKDFCEWVSQYPSFDNHIVTLESRTVLGDGLLHFAVLKNDRRLIRELISNGLDPNLRGEGGYTPLHKAVEAEAWEMADELIKGGGGQIRNCDGLTPDELCQVLYGDMLKNMIVKKIK